MKTTGKRIFKNALFLSIIYLICFSTSYLTCISCDDEEEKKDYLNSSMSSLALKSSSLSDPSIISHYPSTMIQKCLSEEYEEKLSILVIEDQILIWDIFKNTFKRIRKDFEKFKLFFAPTGLEGIKLHTLHRPCLTFIDYHLKKEMNGKDVIETLKKKCEGPFKNNLGYLVAFSNDVEMNASMGADFQIPKMLDIKLFKEALHRGLPP